MRVMAVLVTMVLVGALVVTRAEAQTAPPAASTPPGVQIETTPAPSPERPAVIVPPGLHYETTRPTDAGNYPHDVRVEHDPAFIEPFAQGYETTTSSGHFGLAGWTSPNTPVGPSVIGYREVNGWFGFGFSIVWGGPPRAARPVPAGLPTAPVR